MLEGLAFALGGMLGVAVSASHRSDSLSLDTPSPPVNHAGGCGLWGAVYATEIALSTAFASWTDEERAHYLAQAATEKERAGLLRLFPRPLTQVGPLDV